MQAPGFTQSFNRYSYAWNNPLKFIDPSGETNYRWCRGRNWWVDSNGRSASESDVFLWMHGVNSGNNFSGMPDPMSNSWANDMMHFSNFGRTLSTGAGTGARVPIAANGAWHHLHVHETELWWNITRNPDGSEHRGYYTREVYRGMEWVWMWNNSPADARMGNWGSSNGIPSLLGPAMAAAGQPWIHKNSQLAKSIFPRSMVTKGARTNTSLASLISRRISTSVGVSFVGGVVGRAIPGLGWAIIFVDLAVTPLQPVQPLPFEPAPVDNTRVVVPNINTQPW